jgi:ribose-phosphate pyrophosphokinase
VIYSFRGPYTRAVGSPLDRPGLGSRVGGRFDGARRNLCSVVAHEEGLAKRRLSKLAHSHTRTIGQYMYSENLMLFALNASRDFAQRVGAELGIALSDHEEREFEFGHHKSRPLVNVRGRDVFVIQLLHGDLEQSVNDKLCRLLFFLGALRDASAANITAVVPFLCYSRKDQKTKARDPVITRYVASLFEAVGVDRVVTLDVHNVAAFQNAFRCRTDHLEATSLFVDYFAPRLRDADAVVVSPDPGGIKRAGRFQQALSPRLAKPVTAAFMEKFRSEDRVTGDAMVGDLDGRFAIIVDDMISSGTTIARAAQGCRLRGATQVCAAVSHGVFTVPAGRVLLDPALDQIVVLDTIPPFALDRTVVEAKLVMVPAAALFAEAIRRMHRGESLVELLEV